MPTVCQGLAVIAYGSTLSNDRHAGKTFDYLIANPPYGKDWKRDEAAVRAEHERGGAGRFCPGLPRISDGQLLFLLHMLAHTKEPGEGGSRIAIIMNGSPFSRPCPSVTRRRQSAATRMEIPSPIPNCATPKACRSPRPSRPSSTGR